MNPTEEKAKADKPKPEKAKADKPKPEKAKADKSKPDKAKADKPKSDKAKGDKPKPEKSKGDEPKPEKAKGEKPKPEKAKDDKPKPEKAKGDKPKPEKAKDDKPKPEKAKGDKPKPEKAKDDKPKPEKAKGDKSKPEKAKGDKPKPEKAKVDKPKPEKAKVDKPKPEKAKVDKPKSEKAKGDKPKPEKAKDDKSKAKKAKVEKPKPEKARSDKPKSVKAKGEKPKSVKGKGEKPKSVKAKGEKPESVKAKGEKPESVKAIKGDKPKSEKAELDKPKADKPKFVRGKFREPVNKKRYYKENPILKKKGRGIRKKKYRITKVGRIRFGKKKREIIRKIMNPKIKKAAAETGKKIPVQVTKPVGGEKDGGTRTILVKKPPAYYPTEVRRKKCPAQKKQYPCKLKKSLIPGTVCIVLAGPHKGKRVVFLKQFQSGLCLITGPLMLNECPLRRINQIYLIGTATKVDLGQGFKVSDHINDIYFKHVRIVPRKHKKEEGDIFATKVKKCTGRRVKRTDQKAVDSAVMKAIRKRKDCRSLLAYMTNKFCLRNHHYPHLLKF